MRADPDRPVPRYHQTAEAQEEYEQVIGRFPV